MAKKKTLYECQACGMQSPRWMGKCPNCGAWESFVELTAEQQKVLGELSKAKGTAAQATPITQIEEEEVSRFSSGDSELDLVLGGGIVPGSLVLIGGSPGIG